MFRVPQLDFPRVHVNNSPFEYFEDEEERSIKLGGNKGQSLALCRPLL